MAFLKNKICIRAVVLAQLAERSLSTQEYLGSIPAISNFNTGHLHLLSVEKTKIKKKRPF